MEDYKSIQLRSYSEPLPKDYPIEKLIATVNVFPDSFCLDISSLKIKYQTAQSCVANALATTREITEYQQSHKYKQFSVGYIYANRDNAYDGEGLVPGMAHEIVRKYGVCEYKEFPYDTNYPTLKSLYEKDKKNLDSKAYPYRISSYCLVRKEFEIKNALMQIGAITLSIPIYNSFYESDKWNKYVCPIPDKIKEKCLGGHDIVVVGWRPDNTMICINSWGENWKDNGKFYIPFDYPYFYGYAMADNILPNEKLQYYRVQMGAFKNKNNVVKLQEQMKTKGFKTYIVYVNNLYKLQMGAFSIRENAERLSKQLTNLGYKNFITKY